MNQCRECERVTSGDCGMHGPRVYGFQTMLPVVETDYVRCCRCGARCSRDVEGKLVVRAWVECPECSQNKSHN